MDLGFYDWCKFYLLGVIELLDNPCSGHKMRLPTQQDLARRDGSRAHHIIEGCEQYYAAIDQYESGGWPKVFDARRCARCKELWRPKDDFMPLCDTCLKVAMVTNAPAGRIDSGR